MHATKPLILFHFEPIILFSTLNQLFLCSIMKHYILILISLTITLLPNIVWSHDCVKLENEFKQIDLQSKLINWVDSNFEKKGYLKRNQLTTLYHVNPGIYSLKNIDFDWSLLENYDKKSRMAVVGIDYSDFKVPEWSVSKEKIQSILFTYKSNFGVLVRTSYSDDFIKDKEKPFIKILSERVAVYCKKTRDSESYGK